MPAQILSVVRSVPQRIRFVSRYHHLHKIPVDETKSGDARSLIHRVDIVLRPTATAEGHDIYFRVDSNKKEKGMNTYVY